MHELELAINVTYRVFMKLGNQYSVGSMILINKYTKLSRHIARMNINDWPLIKQIMRIGFSSATFLL